MIKKITTPQAIKISVLLPYIHFFRKVINGSNGISSSKEDLFANWQQGQKFLTSTPLVSSCSVVSSYNAINRRVPHLTPSEETSPTEMFQCLQLSRDIKAKETSSSDDVVSPSYDNFKPSSPSTEGSESNLLKEFDKEDSNKKQGDMVQSTVAEKPDDENIISPKETVGGYQNETSLPKWQKDCILEESEKTYSTSIGGTLSRTTSEISTDNAIIISSVGEGSSLQQWQSQQNDSDELFENDNSTPTNTNFINLQVHNGSQLPHANGLILPELSEDIFHPRAKSKY